MSQKLWRFKQMLRQHGLSLIVVMLASVSLAYYSMIIPSTPAIKNEEVITVAVTPWSETKKLRLWRCLEDLEDAREMCAVYQDIKTCNNWMVQSWRCDQWRK